MINHSMVAYILRWNLGRKVGSAGFEPATYAV